MILIVDDFADGAEALCRLIERQGYDCRWAGGGREALAMIRAQPAEQPLLVLLDEMMPEMNGIEVLRELRNDPRIAATPVIMYSLNLMKREEAMALGTLNWMLKGQDMLMIVKEIIGQYEHLGGVPSGAKSTPAD